MPGHFAVVGLPVLTGTASYTNRLQVLLASMAQNESVDILSFINTCTPSTKFIAFHLLGIPLMHILFFLLLCLPLSVGLPWVLLYSWLWC